MRPGIVPSATKTATSVATRTISTTQAKMSIKGMAAPLRDGEDTTGR
jgi:hypothetical protein